MGRPNGRDADSTSNWSHRCRAPTSPNPSPDPDADEIHDHEQTLARGNREQIRDRGNREQIHDLEQTHDRHRGNREQSHAHHHDHVPVRARRLLPWRDRNNRRRSGPPSPTSASCAWVKRHLLSSRPPKAMSGRCGARTRSENRDKTSDMDGKTMAAFRGLRQACDDRALRGGAP